MLITARITPSSPSVAMMGATPAIGPEEACFTSKRIKINSTSAAKSAPPIIAIGNATFFYINFLAHAALIEAATVTVATWTAATVKPQLFVRTATGWGRAPNGEHE